MTRELSIYTDGACSGNPGVAAIAVVIQENGREIKRFGMNIGEATNNIAEYTAVIYALQEALILRADVVTLFTDSELLYKQVIGSYKVKHPNMKPLFEQVRHLITGFKRFEIKHVPREKNNEADGLAKKLINKEQAKVVAFPLQEGREESPSSEG